MRSRKRRSHEQDGGRLSVCTGSQTRNSVRRSCHGLRMLLRLNQGLLNPSSSLGSPIAAERGARHTRDVVRTHVRAENPCAVSSTANTQPLDQLLIPAFVVSLEIIEELATLGHQLEQPASRMVVLDVGLEVFCQAGNSFRQDSDL